MHFLQIPKCPVFEQNLLLALKNSFLISPLAQNNWFERCFAFEAQRMVDTQKLHNMLFDPSQIKDLENGKISMSDADKEACSEGK